MSNVSNYSKPAEAQARMGSGTEGSKAGKGSVQTAVCGIAATLKSIKL